jgi:predicted GNAT family N-acyltransferase
VHTKALDWIRQVDEAVRLLWDAALLGVDAYPSLAAEKVSQAKRILDSRGDIEGEQESGNEGIGEETVAKAVRGQKDRQALLREALTVLKEIRSLLRTLP